jgi:hypothetical protein
MVQGLAPLLRRYAIIQNMTNFMPIKNLRRETILSILRVAVILVLAGVVFAIVFLQEKRGKEEPAKKAGQEVTEQLTDEEKIKILESLSAPLGAPHYSDKEKEKILKSLSAPSGQPTLSDEEKKKKLESLSAPQK